MSSRSQRPGTRGPGPGVRLVERPSRTTLEISLRSPPRRIVPRAIVTSESGAHPIVRLGVSQLGPPWRSKRPTASVSILARPRLSPRCSRHVRRPLLIRGRCRGSRHRPRLFRPPSRLQARRRVLRGSRHRRRPRLLHHLRPSPPHRHPHPRPHPLKPVSTSMRHRPRNSSKSFTSDLPEPQPSNRYVRSRRSRISYGCRESDRHASLTSSLRAWPVWGPERGPRRAPSPWRPRRRCVGSLAWT